MGLHDSIRKIISTLAEGKPIRVIFAGAVGAIAIGIIVNLISYWLTKPIEVKLVSSPSTAEINRSESAPPKPAPKMAENVPKDADSTFCKQINYVTDNPELDEMYDVAWNLDHGRGMTVNHERARELYRSAADRGHRASQYNLGVSMHRGIGGPVDNPRAVYYFKLAAAQNDYLAILNLASAYTDAWPGVDRNFSKALEYMLIASRCDEGSVSNNIGVLFSLGGFGIDRELDKAAGWFRKAEVQGSMNAEKNLQIISDGFNPDVEKVTYDEFGPA